MSEPLSSEPMVEQKSLMGRMLWFCLTNKLIIFLFVVMIVGGGFYVAPFDWQAGGLPRNPVPVDAIPDIGENQQIVFTEWMGRSPQDVEDQVTYPLTVSLLGVPGVKTIRSNSMFGFSSIYIVFEEFSWYERVIEGKDFYWTRSRVLEKLNSLSPGILPAGVQPTLGPDSTALGQIFWYTLEGRDPDGNYVGGWNLEELRTIQDWYVRYGLMGASGVSEVASVGGFVREYHVDVDPYAMQAYDINLSQVYQAIKASNIDVGAKTMEFNQVEYFIRGVGFIKKISDIENSVVKVVDNVPILIKQIANVTLGPAIRRGALDKEGAEAVGGVVVARYGDNPLEVIKNVKEKINSVSPGLPEKVVIDYSKIDKEGLIEFAKERDFQPFVERLLNQPDWLKCIKTMPSDQQPEWATISQVTIVPFYDRTELIQETLGTLSRALTDQILVTMIVVILMVMHLRSSILISATLPLTVLICFIAMKLFGVDANVVALSGIAIAIGTVVDMGIVVCENILRHLDKADKHANRLEVIHKAVSQVGSAVLTAVLTTVISFLPIFTMTGQDGKLFKPLAFTKTFALLASIVVALTIIPPAAHMLFGFKLSASRFKQFLRLVLVGLLSIVGFILHVWVGLIILVLCVYYLYEHKIPSDKQKILAWCSNIFAILFIGILLTKHWLPVGYENGVFKNFIFIVLLFAILLGGFKFFQSIFESVLGWCLAYKPVFLILPLVIIAFGLMAWLGFDQFVDVDKKTLNPQSIKGKLAKNFPGLGKEDRPSLDEGSFLYMPNTMFHASIGEAMDVLKKQDMAMLTIEEIDTVVGKIGRAETPLDPAPISMIETIINYKSEYITDENGKQLLFKYDDSSGEFVRDDSGQLIIDSKGKPFRQWRDHIKSPDDIWTEIEKVVKIPGTVHASMLQPISARLVMLQSGIKAPFGVRVMGSSLEEIENVGMQIEKLLKQVPSVEASKVFSIRIVGKPYLEIIPDRQALARYGVPIKTFQDMVEIAIGGKTVTHTVEGRQRFPVRVRYKRELRNELEAIDRILVPGAGGVQIPLVQLADIQYVRGPQSIKSEDNFLVGHVLFDKKSGLASIDVVEECDQFLRDKAASGELVLPGGVSYDFTGTYANYIRSQKTLAVVMPVALLIIFVILYCQFKSVLNTLSVFSGIFVAWAGGFLLIWMYGQPWFLDFNLFGINLRELFQVQTINMNVAVWVGFLALFGIATDDGVIMTTYLNQVFRKEKPDSIKAIRQATIKAAKRRVRPCLMTSATTILALLPVLTSVGRGSDIMVPMAIPSFGGMLIVLISIFIVPVLYCWIQELKFRFK